MLSAKHMEDLYGRATSRTYREKAERARKLAESAATPHLKTMFLEIAATYEELADLVEDLARQRRSLLNSN